MRTVKNNYLFICHFKTVRDSLKIPTVLNLRLKKQCVFILNFFFKNKGALLKKQKAKILNIFVTEKAIAEIQTVLKSVCQGLYSMNFGR